MSWDDEDNDWDAGAATKDVGGDDDGPLNDKWDGEDDDAGGDNLLGDDWDAEPKKDEAPKPAVKKALTKRQLIKKKEDEERMAALKRAEKKKSGPEDAAAALAARKKAIDESNDQLCDDLFGGEGFEAPAGGEFKNEQLETDNVDMIVTSAMMKNLQVKQEEPLELDPLKTMEDFKKFAVKVSAMAVKKSGTRNPKMLLEFVNTVMIECTKGLKLDDSTLIKKKITVICTQKQKDEKGKAKKAASKKAQLSMGGGSKSNTYGGGDDGYDDHGDY